MKKNRSFLPLMIGSLVFVASVILMIAMPEKKVHLAMLGDACGVIGLVMHLIMKGTNKSVEAPAEELVAE